MKKAVLVSCFNWYPSRLVYVEKYLRKKGYDVTVILSDFHHLTKRTGCDYSDNDAVSYIHVMPYKKNVSAARAISHCQFAFRAWRMVKKMKPDLVWALVPPNGLVKKLARKSNQYELVFDIIDMWPESFSFSHKEWFPFAFWAALRNKYLNKADIVSLECAYYKEALEAFADEKKFRIFRLIKEDFEHTSEREPFSEDVCLCYLGSINSLVDTESIGKLIGQISSRHSVRVRIVGDGNRRDELIRVCEENGAAVDFYGKIFDPREKEKLLANCHFGINVYKSTIKVGLTLKSIDYFQMGIPVLNAIPGDTENYVQEKQVGINLKEFSMERFDNVLENTDQYRKRARELFLTEFDAANSDKIVDGVLRMG